MANDLNQCNFIGRLGRDPEVRYMPNGDALASFSIAVGWKTKDKEGAEWANIEVYGKLAEICGEYLKKGSQVFISARMQTQTWKDKDTGADKYKTVYRADRMQMLGGKDGSNDSGNTSAPESQNNQPQAQQAAAAPTGFDDFEDDLPF